MIPVETTIVTAPSTLPRPRTPSRTTPAVDFDLHGLVGIRLVDPSAADVEAVSRQLGPIRKELDREPDLVIRFVDSLSTESPLCLVGPDAGFVEDSFLVLRAKHKAPARVSIPFESLGGPVEVVCRRGLPAVPLLLGMVNLTALAGGALPVHASAFRYAGKGVLVTGWAKGGKTETLLAFLMHGGQYVGDEWVYVGPDGRRMYGIPEPIRVWDWYFPQLPEDWRRVSAARRFRLLLLRHATRWLDRLAGTDRAASGWRRDVRRLDHLLTRQRYARLPPRETFGSSRSVLEAPLDKIVLVVSHESPDTRVEPLGVDELVERMAVSLEEERSELLSCYRKFRFAFPGRRNEWIESVRDIERSRLRTLLGDKERWAVYHPYPASIPKLYETLLPLVRD